MNEASSDWDLVLQIINRSPQLVGRIEAAAAYAQGKGYGTATIEQEVALALKLLGRAPALAVDIGGNVGHYSGELRRRAPDLEIHIFEPAATNMETLTARFKGDRAVSLIAAALSDVSGDAVLFSNEAGSGLASLTKRRLDHFNIPFDHQEAVITVRFETYWNDVLNRRSIDFAKLDIEGHEFSALRAFGEAIHFTRLIQFEFGGCNIDTRTYFQDFWYFFRQNGFDLFRIGPAGLEPIGGYREADEFFSTTNYLALNRTAR